MTTMRFQKRHSVLPGFGLTLGFSLFYLCLVVLIPLAALALKAASYGWGAWWQATTAPRGLPPYRLTLRPAPLRRVARRRARERRLRPRRGLGAGALPLPRPAGRGRPRGPALRPA